MSITQKSLREYHAVEQKRDALRAELRAVEDDLKLKGAAISGKLSLGEPCESGKWSAVLTTVRQFINPFRKVLVGMVGEARLAEIVAEVGYEDRTKLVVAEAAALVAKVEKVA